MIVLWDDTVFERLWCNYEVAVHAKTSASCAFTLVPVWEPAWNVAWLASWFAFGCSIDPSQRQLSAWDPSSEWSLFVSFWETYYVSPIVFLVASIPCTWLCLQRFKHHKLMLDQMSSFELRDAKCTLETDRILIMEQILGLFEPALSVSFETKDSTGRAEQQSTQTREDHALISPRDIEEIQGTSYPTKEEIMDLFNAYVRGPLRETAMRSTGRGDHVPFTLCIGACLPVFFTAVATVLDCDGLGDCHRAAAHCGYPSVSRYILGNVVMDLFLQQLFWGICCPLVVRTNGLAARLVSGTGPNCFWDHFSVQDSCILHAACPSLNWGWWWCYLRRIHCCVFLAPLLGSCCSSRSTGGYSQVLGFGALESGKRDEDLKARGGVQKRMVEGWMTVLRMYCALLWATAGWFIQVPWPKGGSHSCRNSSFDSFWSMWSCFVARFTLYRFFKMTVLEMPMEPLCLLLVWWCLMSMCPKSICSVPLVQRLEPLPTCPPREARSFGLPQDLKWCGARCNLEICIADCHSKCYDMRLVNRYVVHAENSHVLLSQGVPA